MYLEYWRLSLNVSEALRGFLAPSYITLGNCGPGHHGRQAFNGSLPHPNNRVEPPKQGLL